MTPEERASLTWHQVKCAVDRDTEEAMIADAIRESVTQAYEDAATIAEDEMWVDSIRPFEEIAAAIRARKP